MEAKGAGRIIGFTHTGGLSVDKEEKAIPRDARSSMVRDKLVHRVKLPKPHKVLALVVLQHLEVEHLVAVSARGNGNELSMMLVYRPPPLPAIQKIQEEWGSSGVEGWFRERSDRYQKRLCSLRRGGERERGEKKVMQFHNPPPPSVRGRPRIDTQSRQMQCGVELGTGLPRRQYTRD